MPLKLAAPRVGCIGMSMSTLTIKCACCGEPLTAPERTEYVDDFGDKMTKVTIVEPKK